MRAHVMAGLVLSAFAGIAAELVPCVETAVGTEPGKDKYVYDWNHLRYNWHIGAKPFHGPESLSVTVEPVFRGDMVLRLKDMESGEKLLYTSRWDKVTVFATKLPAARQYQFEEILCRTKERTLSNGVYRIVRFDGLFLETQAGACRFGVETGNPLHLVRSADEQPVFTLRNPSDRTLRWSGTFVLSDLFGHVIRKSFDVTVAAGATQRLPLGEPLPGKGLWTVNAEIRGADGSVAHAETRFAVLDRHDVTPPLADGKFRMGINYHYGRFSPKDRELSFAALVASGAKLARVGACNRSAVQAKGPDCWDWEAADRTVNLFWTNGIPIDDGCWGNPRWAARPENRTNKTWQVWWTLPPEDLKLCEEFFARAASRYGRKIAYYEIGNEWDLERPFFPNGTEEDALTALKTAYTGIKRGCPEAVVTPCGWAFWDSARSAVRRKGLCENVMTKGKGFYDVHAVHLHGPFRNYRKAILGRFLPRRKAMGITAPWYSNETALTSVFGNEIGAAEAVWQKILFAWAYGSTDFIWYNLIATGWNPKDGEQGYGMMTPDYHPRATYAAFSALTALLSGFDFDRIIGSESAYELYRFKGQRDGIPELVVTGWSSPAADGRTVRIKTDAPTVELVDFMGNHTPQSLADGTAVLTLHRRPQAVVFRGGSYAKAYAKDIAALAELGNESIAVGEGAFDSRPADLVVDKAEYVFCPYDANPATESRIWKGTDDCSFRAWFGSDAKGSLKLRVRIEDDVLVQKAKAPRAMSEGDCLRLTIGVKGDPADWELGFRLKDTGVGDFCIWTCPGDAARSAAAEKGIVHTVRREGREVVHDIELPKDAFNLPDDLFGGDVRLALKVDDNDGEGRDFWMGLEDTFRLERRK